jgi:hypothetical protein
LIRLWTTGLLIIIFNHKNKHSKPINTTMQFLIIYPGRFHPFHRGHLASYEYLTKKFGDDAVYIATSDVQAPITSPFSFADKVKMITKLGIPSSHVVRVKNPYQAREITDSLSNEEKANTVLIFAVSDKDMQEGSARFQFGTKKNGEPSYLQPMPENSKQMKPMNKHAYVAITPTVNFRVQGADANSASQIRKLYIESNPQDRNNIIADLYGEAYSDIKDIFDQRLAASEKIQDIIYGTPIVDAGIKEPGMREHREKIKKLLEHVTQLERRVQQSHEPIQEELDHNPDYLEEKWSQKYKGSINCANPKGFSQRAHCAGRKKK